jgi:hypothetical protein
MRQIGSQSSAIVSQFLVSANAVDGYYTSIQAAINKAVSDSVQAVVVIKPGIYTENVVLASGIDLLCLGDQNTSQAILHGSISVSSSITNCTVTNLNFYNFNQTEYANYVHFVNCTLTGGNIANNTIAITNVTQNAITHFTDCTLSNNGPSSYLINFNSNSTLILDGSTNAITVNNQLSFVSATPLQAFIICKGFGTSYSLQAGTALVPPTSSYVSFARQTPLPAQQIFQDINVDFDNVIFGNEVLFNGCRGSVKNSTFSTQGYTTTAGTACLNYNTGTSSATSIMTFEDCMFETDVGYAITGTSASEITVINSTLNNPNSPFLAPTLFYSSFLSTLTSVNYGATTPLRVSRDQNTSSNRCAGVVVSAAINPNNNGNSFKTCNSLIDVNVAASASSFGYWSSNAVYNGSSWTCEGDGTNNGGGYLSVNPLGVMQQGVFPSSGGNYVTPSYPSCTLTLRNFQQEFYANWGSFTGSQEVKTQATTQTANNSSTTIYSVALNQNESIMFKGTIVASTADHTDVCAGSFEACATRSSGNIFMVGTPVININASTVASFNISVNPSSQTINLNVIGLGATVYNWSTFVTYHMILSNT